MLQEFHIGQQGLYQYVQGATAIIFRDTFQTTWIFWRTLLTRECNNCDGRIEDDRPFLQIQAVHIATCLHYYVDSDGYSHKRPLDSFQREPVAATGTLNFCEHCFRSHYRPIYKQLRYLRKDSK